MKIRTLTSPALGVLASSISFGDVITLTFDQTLVRDMAEVSSRENISVSREVEVDTVEVDSTTTQTVIPPSSNIWDEHAKIEFLELLKKQALQVINPSESIRYERLKEIRRRYSTERTFAEIQADIEFHRNVQSAINAIQRLTNNGTGSYFTST